jgi:hypothetical protein
LVEKLPPSAVILGVEMQILEEPLFETAIAPDSEIWTRKVYENGPVVYFRRSSGSSIQMAIKEK